MSYTDRVFAHDAHCNTIHTAGPEPCPPPGPPRRVVTVDFEVAQAVFDCAVGSMNFGSGFLDDDEVHALRRFAEAIGVNPMAGTPSEYSKRILHVYEQTDYVDHWTKEKATYCKWCSLPEHDANGIHRGGMDLYGRVAD